MLDHIIQWDIATLEWIHSHLHNDFLNRVMPLFRNKLFWIPLYIFLVAFTLMNFRSRGWVWILLFIFTVGVCDQVSSKGIKYSLKRLRPCHTEIVQDNIDLLIPCGGLYSFTSSHATNHFGMAVFIILTLGRVFRRIRWPFFLWACLVSFAQVYVGVHYPLDIICGGILGSIIGGLVAWYFNARWGFSPREVESTEEQAAFS